MDKYLKPILVWIRRDLRCEDQAALSHALRSAHRVWCVFVFDTDILDPLPRRDRRVEFIHGSVVALDQTLRQLGGGLIVRHGKAVAEVTALARQLDAGAVFTNHDYEPAAVQRDTQARDLLAETGIGWRSWKDQVVFETDEIMTGTGTPYSVFTPYKNTWLKRLRIEDLTTHPVHPHTHALTPVPPPLDTGVPTLQQLGFEAAGLSPHLTPGSAGAQALLQDFLDRIDDYATARDYPAVKGPSYLGVHLRFGTVSIRQLARLAWDRTQAASRGAEIWLSELIWRDFYHQILHHHPHVVDRPFRAEYNALVWDTGPEAQQRFTAWCEGRTGYPLVDAAMAQLNQTGYMHNRLRMLTASFLTKDLGLDWRWGERYFAEKLNDYDLAANNGGWQWAASTGCDAQPYFRIFNPVTQSRKFDPQGKFIRRYLPALARLNDTLVHTPWQARPLQLQESGLTLGQDYPFPVVDHDMARRLTLARFAAARAA